MKKFIVLIVLVFSAFTSFAGNIVTIETSEFIREYVVEVDPNENATCFSDLSHTHVYMVKHGDQVIVTKTVTYYTKDGVVLKFREFTYKMKTNK